MARHVAISIQCSIVPTVYPSATHLVLNNRILSSLPTELIFTLHSQPSFLNPMVINIRPSCTQHTPTQPETRPGRGCSPTRHAASSGRFCTGLLGVLHPSVLCSAGHRPMRLIEVRGSLPGRRQMADADGERTVVFLQRRVEDQS